MVNGLVLDFMYSKKYEQFYNPHFWYTPQMYPPLQSNACIHLFHHAFELDMHEEKGKEQTSISKGWNKHIF